MAKTRECVGCGILTDDPGQILCSRCRMKESAPPGKKTVLLIDDEMEVIKELKEKIEASLLYNVIMAYDGMKGLEKLRYESPELIIVDVLMPRMNGHEFVKKLRENKKEKIKNIPVIVISEKEKMKSFFHPWDIHSFFVKPVDTDKLLEAMKEILRKKKEG